MFRDCWGQRKIGSHRVTASQLLFLFCPVLFPESRSTESSQQANMSLLYQVTRELRCCDVLSLIAVQTTGSGDEQADAR